MSREFDERIRKIAEGSRPAANTADGHPAVQQSSYEDHDVAAESLLAMATDLLGAIRDHVFDEGSIVEDQENDGPLESRVRRLVGDIGGRTAYLQVVCNLKGKSLAMLVRGESSRKSLSDSQAHDVDILQADWLPKAQQWLESELEMATRRLCK